MQIAKEPIEEWFQTILGLKWHSMVIWIELITLSPIPSFYFILLLIFFYYLQKKRCLWFSTYLKMGQVKELSNIIQKNHLNLRSEKADAVVSTFTALTRKWEKLKNQATLLIFDTFNMFWNWLLISRHQN